MTAMDMRMFDNAIARWVVQDPVIHHFQSPYNGFDGNPVYWADPSGADAIKTNDAFIFTGDDARGVFSALMDGTSYTTTGNYNYVDVEMIQDHNGNGGGTDSGDQSVKCKECKLVGGIYDGKTFEEIQQGQSPWYIRISGINKITSKAKKSWEDFDNQIEEEIADLDDIEDLLNTAAGIAGFAPLDLSVNTLKDIFNSKNKIKAIRDLTSKIKNTSFKNVNMFMLGVALYLESKKLGIRKDSLIKLNNNNIFEQGSENGLLIITNTHISRGTTGLSSYSFSEVYSADNGTYIGRIR